MPSLSPSHPPLAHHYAVRLRMCELFRTASAEIEAARMKAQLYRLSSDRASIFGDGGVDEGAFEPLFAAVGAKDFDLGGCSPQ